MDFLDQGEDQDKFFSYNTKQQVNIQDRWLGITNIFLQVGILLYIVFGIFVHNKGYLDVEQARGAVATHIRGDAISQSNGKEGQRYFSGEELTYPGLENGNVFVATRQRVMRQKRGVCEDKAMSCVVDSDCTVSVEGKCTERGFCEEPAWCNQDDEPEIYELDVGDLIIWVKSSIQFVRLAPEKIYTTEIDHAYPERGVNAFSVRDLLMMCEPVPVRYEEIAELGAVIEVQVVWGCDVRKDLCVPEVKARRIDVQFDPHNIGYTFGHAEYVGDDERLLNTMQGVRIFLRSVGVGRKLSVNALIMKASTAGSLLAIAPLVADLLMLSVFARKAKYYARKYEVSPDFSEYMDSLDAKRKEEASTDTAAIDGDEEEAQRLEEEWQRKLDEEDG